jgi:hypothetical protein
MWTYIIGAAVTSNFCNFLHRVTHGYPHSFHYFEHPGLDIRKLMMVVNQLVLVLVLVLVSPNDEAVDEGISEYCEAPKLLNALEEALRACIMERKARFGYNWSLDSGSRVLGFVPALSIHSSIAFRLYVVPSGVITGSSMSSAEIPQ